MNQVAFLLACLAASSEQLDSFNDPANARTPAGWVAAEGTPPVQSEPGIGLRVVAPFQRQQELKRAVIDRKVRLNLSAPTAFSLEVNIPDPQAIQSLTLYFHSPDGWFSGYLPLSGSGWQTVRCEKSNFRPEGHPAGWHNIDQIRIAIWKRTSQQVRPRDTFVLIKRLQAHWNSTALVLPEPDGQETNAAYQAADIIEHMLTELGTGVDRLSETSLLHGSIGRRKLLILPYNRPTPDVVQKLVEHVEQGGKIFLCYDVPTPLQKVLGFSKGTYYRPEGTVPRLETIHFKDDELFGLPETVKQASWNITTCKPSGHGAKVIGWWHNTLGEATGHPAMLLSERGAYFSHVVLRDDWERKKQMLAVVLGRLSPDIWQDLFRTQVQRAEQIGHCRSPQQLEEYVEPMMNAEGRQKLKVANQLARQAAKQLSAGQGYEAVESLKRCRELRVDVYLAAQPSPAREGRAFWEHSGTGPYPGDWDRTCRELAQAGFNIIIPNMLWAGAAHYPSKVLPRSEIYRQYGDQIEQCLAAARKHGLEVHVWKVNHNPGRYAPPEFLERMRREGRTQVDIDGNVTDWLNPAHPDNFRLEVDSMLEVVRRYDVDGIHFDYIRYPHGRCDYSGESRKRFEADTGLVVKNWPKDCYSGPLHDAYRDWRAAQITRLVETVSREARKIRPGIKISAAVFSSYPACRVHVAQDWPLWAKRGYVDFLCPMNYTEDDRQYQEWITSQRKLLGDVLLYPGIGASASRSHLTADRVVGQIHLTRTLGADGFTIFNLTEQTAQEILPGIAVGAGRTPAVPPHRSSSKD